ncbi:MAG: HAD-IIA family hydrolase, partial [archaeon]
MIIPFKNIKHYIFDLDGTIWTYRDLLPEANYVIDRIRRKEKEIHFTTNNTLLSRSDYAKKLLNLGIKTTKEHIFSAGYVASKYFEEKGIQDLYLIGEHGLIQDLSDAGVRVSENANDVLIGIDRNFNYSKLKHAADLINKGAEVYCTGISKYFRVGTDLYPGEAPIIKAIETLTGKMPIHLGKPSDVFKARLSTDLTLFPEDVLLVGDDLTEDIVFANKCGFKSALVLTGNTSKEQAEEATGLKKPGAIIRDLKEIVT